MLTRNAKYLLLSMLILLAFSAEALLWWGKPVQIVVREGRARAGSICCK